ncbi:MAG: D-aminoacylase (Aspartate, glutamate ETC) [Parcubacteria group bacterium Athens0714_26]|nr:MAG: D-aminoacylase (Aspartate, glutamate ETC) [Parcubacteria group bacterium Athens1014_26]TSD03298.1 MAG: D-aminoacylase (Aspartate, glutamate ETC) [Parcubacteria group bacterium Athens0714_26]
MILIKQAQIVDGSGKKPFRGDILINGQKISAINSVIKKKADKIIDGLGLIAAPGFIDVNTDSDHYLSLFTNPSQKDFISQGVTTIIGGQCGSSLAPLMYGSLAGVSEWTNSEVNVDWRGLKEFFKIIQKIKLGIRFETLVGHSTIKRDLVGDTPRDLTDSELQVFSKILEDALKSDALGLSTGLGHAYENTASYYEIKTLVNIVARYNKVYATHLRNEKENLLKSINETLAIARETGAKTIISHFRPIRGFEKEFEESLNLIEKGLGETNVYFDVNPFEISLIPIYSMLPYWAQDATIQKMLEFLDNEITREKIVQEMAKIELGDLVVDSAAGHDYLVGKNLEEIAKNTGKNPIDSLFELMKITKFRVMFFSKNLDSRLIINMLFHPRSLIGSNSASLPQENKKFDFERATLTFPRFLEIAAGHNMPIEETIKKITSFPAKIYGLKNRGIIKEGLAADITLLKDQKIAGVILNGKQVLTNG